MKKYIDIERIVGLSKGDESVALYQKIIKLSEEAGEISDAVDNFEIKEVVEELCDTINVAVDIINALNSTNDFGDDIYQIDSTIIDVPSNYELSEIEFVNRINSEVGKCSQAFLRLDGSKNVSKSAGDGKLALLKQVNEVIRWCDTTIQLIENHYDSISEDFIVEMFSKKLNKWEAKQLKYKAQS